MRTFERLLFCAKGLLVSLVLCFSACVGTHQSGSLGAVYDRDIVVGVFKPSDMIEGGIRSRSDAIADALNAADGISARLVGEINASSFGDIDVFIVPNERGATIINDSETHAFLRDWVERGHGLMTTHDATGYRRYTPVIPEVAYGTGNYYSEREPYANRICVNIEHPVTKELERSEIFTTAYFDYITLQPGDNAQVVLRGVEAAGAGLFAGPPALVAGEFGDGRYVACGLLLGGIAPAAAPEIPIGGELSVLLNAVRYLAGARGWLYEAGEEVGHGSFLVAEERDEEGREILPGVSIRKMLDACQIPHEAEWRDSSPGTPPELDNVPDGTPVLTDEQYERCISAKPYNRFPESWERVDLCGEWSFIRLADTEKNPENDEGTVGGFWNAGFDDSEWEKVNVPTLPVKELEGFIGVQWFRRRFKAPDSPAGRYVLRFGGADSEVKVFVNGKDAGYHAGRGYPFEIDITEAVQPGAENLIAVRNFDGRGALKGLYETIELQVRPAVYARSILINPVLDESAIEINAELFNSGDETTVAVEGLTEPYESVLADVKGKRMSSSAELGDIVLKPGMNEVFLKMKLDSPVHWSPDNPALYTLTLKTGDSEIGKTRFGFREFKTEGQFYYLNGKRVYPTGILLRSGMFMGPASGGLYPHNPGNVKERRIMGYKNMNFNMLLAHADYHTERFYEICDEIGMMVYSVNFYGPPYKADHADIILWSRTGRTPPDNIEVNPDYIRDIKHYFKYKLHNHPSVAIKAISSEARSDFFQRSHRAAFDAIRSVDMQKRPICVVSGGAPTIAAFPYTDVEDFHIYPGMIGGHAFDHRQLLFDSNIIAWRYNNKQTPVVNWEGVGSMPYIYNNDIDKVRELWGAEELDKQAIVEDIEGRAPGYHMRLGTRWMSLYGIRRMCFDNYASAEKDQKFVSSYHHAYMVRYSGLTGRLAGDLFQGIGFNSGWFWDAFTLIDWEPARRGSVYFGGTAYLRVSGDDLLKYRVGVANSFNEYKRYSNPKLICLDPIDSKNSFAGRLYNATLYAINDTAYESPEWTIRALIYDESRNRVYDATADIGTVPPAKRKLIPFEWMIPAQPENQTYTIELFLYENGSVVSDSSFDFHALGVDAFAGKLDAKGRKLALYDVAEQYGLPSTVAVLEDAGLPYDRITDFSRLNRYDVLLIGAASLDNTVHRANDRIKNWVESGGRMVIFEQIVPGQLPVVSRMSITKKHGGSVLDMVDPAHPVFKGLQNNDYWSLWNGPLPTAEHYGKEGGIYANLIGPLNSTVVAIGVRDMPRATDKAVQMVMSDVRLGDGIVFITQAEATRRYGMDSVATKFLRNVLEYAVSDSIEFSTPQPEFMVNIMDYYNFGYIDIAEAVSWTYKPDTEWVARVQNDGLADLGQLRFVVADGKGVKLSAGAETVSFGLPDDMRLMYPEHEAERVVKDVDQGTLNLQECELVFMLHAARGGEPGAKIGEYVFTYVDGRVETIDIIKGENIGEFGEREHLSGGRGIGGGLYVTSWMNPDPSRKLRSITVKCVASDTELYVAGVTALLMREKIHD